MAIRLKVLPFATIGALVCAVGSVHAGGPIALTDKQLDRVAAGDAFVTATANGQATGLLTLGFTTTVADVTGSNSPWGSSGGYSSGVAVTVGSNITSAGTASTTVTTGGAVSGNFVVNETYKDVSLMGRPIQGDGFSFSAGGTYVLGILVPGCGATCP